MLGMVPLRISYPGFPSDDRGMCRGKDDMTVMHLQVSISL